MSDLKNEFPDLFQQDSTEQNSDEQPKEQEGEGKDPDSDLSIAEAFKNAAPAFKEYFESSDIGGKTLNIAYRFASYLDSQGLKGGFMFDEDSKDIDFMLYGKYSEILTAKFVFSFYDDGDVFLCTFIYLDSNVDKNDLLEWCNNFNADQMPLVGVRANTDRSNFDASLITSSCLLYVDRPGLIDCLLDYARRAPDAFSKVIG